MGVYLPKNLATSMGIELTYVPQFMCDLHTQLGQRDTDKVQVWELFDCYTQSGFSNVLSANLRRRKVSVYSCGTDPGCVEVPTLPCKTANKLRKTVRVINACARESMLTPVPNYSIGGGAHIHTGIEEAGIDRRQQSRYAAVMQAWACQNPWLAWAFAGVNDNSNAKPITREELCREDTEGVSEDTLERYRRHVEAERRYLVTAERQWHRNAITFAANQFKYEVETMRADVMSAYRDYLRVLTQYREQQKGQPPVVAYKDMANARGKGWAIAYRGDTMEFRCFRMTETTEGLMKLVAVADRVVRLAQAITANTAVEGVPVNSLFTRKELAGMLKGNYRAAKAGFIAMFKELDLNPEDYREYRLNMALRFRHHRKGLRG